MQQGSAAKTVDAQKIHHDAREAMTIAIQAESRLRLRINETAIVFDLEARRDARECVEALDRFDALTEKARALGASL
jgi:hypothetical protein